MPQIFINTHLSAENAMLIYGVIPKAFIISTCVTVFSVSLFIYLFYKRRCSLTQFSPKRNGKDPRLTYETRGALDLLGMETEMHFCTAEQELCGSGKEYLDGKIREINGFWGWSDKKTETFDLRYSDAMAAEALVLYCQQ